MKRLCAALILGILTSSFCSAQIQTGNASYNPSKTGLTISHPSLSFNTHVRVTNLRNNRSVEAVVNGRIPIESERIADISRQAGAALEMNTTGLTLVEIEVIPGRTAAGEPAPAVPLTAAEQPPPAPQGQSPAPPAAQASSSSAPQGQTPPAVPQILPVQTVTDIQYVPVPGPAGSGCCNPLLWVVLVLLLLVIIFLIVILILMLRRFYLWPWHYPVWYRRHLLYVKKRRRETAP
ncbi:MAG: hypothetical protein LBP23_01610 [Treponema sp.]|jgi:hypothetical protein|nr:hypothetical protein [Treponema sp.]